MSSGSGQETTSRPCAIRAAGIVCNLGASIDEVWGRVLDGDQSGFVRRSDLVAGHDILVGAVSSPLPQIPEELVRYDCRNNALSLAALAQIEDEVAATIDAFGPTRVGVVVGTSTSGSAECESALMHEREHGALPPRFRYPQLELGGAAGFIAEIVGAAGPSFALSTACSSGARALASARSLLATGVCDAVIAGGSDSLCGLTTSGFSALKAVSDDVSNPFSVNRAGLTLGEGSALFLVTRDSGGIQLVGVGESTEAHHMSAPDPKGSGAEASMREALGDAGVTAMEIDYLNLHGTGTRLNDAMESAAVARVLGGEVPCSSSKPLVGHCLGSAGAIEVAICWMSIDARSGSSLPLVPHCYDGMRDPELAPIRLAGKGETVGVADRALLMTNSFGFGGNNCTLILGAEEPR